MEKIIPLHGITCIEPLEGSGGWYWGTDHIHGDLYEAQELFQDRHSVTCNRLVLVHHPDGRVVEPVAGRAGQYFGRPIFLDGNIQILLVDFAASLIQICRYDPAGDRTEPVVSLPLAAVKDCYNLMLDGSPLMLTRHVVGQEFQIIWPERADFALGERECFCGRKGDRLYFSTWSEDPDYREEVVVRSRATGRVVERIPGTLMDMPDGQRWILQ